MADCEGGQCQMSGGEAEIHGVQHVMNRLRIELLVSRVEMLWLNPENTWSFIVMRSEFIVLRHAHPRLQKVKVMWRGLGADDDGATGVFVTLGLDQPPTQGANNEYLEGSRQ